MALSLFIIPLYFDYINKGEYGYWTTILDLMALLNILNAGVGVYLVQIIAGEETRGTEATKRELSSLAVIQFTILIVIIPACVLIYLLFPSFSDAADHFPNSSWVYGLMVVNLLVNSIWNWFNSIIYGQNRITISNSLLLIQKTLMQISPIVFLMLGVGLLSFPISYLSINIILLVITFLVAYSFLRKFFSFSNITYVEVKESSIFSLRSLLGGASFYVLNFTDSLIIANYLSVSSVTVYVLTMKLCNFAKFIPAKIIGLAFPSIAQLVSEKHYERLQEITLKFFRVSLRLGLVSTGVIVLLNEIFVPNWVGLDKYGGNTLSLLFGILCLRESIFPIFFNIIYSTKEIKVINYIHFFEAISNIVLSIVFLKFWGITGVALASVLSSCVLSVSYGWYKATKIIKISFTAFIPSLVLTILRTLPSLLVLWAGRVLLLNYFSWISFIAILLCAGLVNLVSFEGRSLLKYRKLTIKQMVLKLIDNA